jgi:hypothetical protein
VVHAVKDQAERFLHISSDFYHPIWSSSRRSWPRPLRSPNRPRFS